MDRAREFFAANHAGVDRFRQLPTLCWLSAGDTFLRGLSLGGVVLAGLLIAGIVPAVVLPVVRERIHGRRARHRVVRAVLFIVGPRRLGQVTLGSASGFRPSSRSRETTRFST